MKRVDLLRQGAGRIAHATATIALLLLAACGGGGSSTGTAGTPAADEPELVGTVTLFYDAPADPALPGAKPPAQIQAGVRGSSGYPRESSTIDPDGTQQYNVAVTLLDGPYLVSHRYAGNSGLLVSAATQAGRANITPLTTMMVAQLLGADPSTAYNNYISSSTDTIARITDANIATAQAKVTAYLQESLGVTVLSGSASFTQSYFVPKAGDPMYETILALNTKLNANGRTLSDVTTAIAAEAKLCLIEDLTITIGSKAIDFCPKSKTSMLDESDATINVYSYTDSKGDVLTVRARDAAVLGTTYVAVNGDIYACSGSGCTGLAIGALDADNGRQLTFAATPLTGATGTVALNGSLHGNKPGVSFPTLACSTNNYFIAYPDGHVDAACAALDNSLGVGIGNAGRVGVGNTTRVRYTFSSDGSVQPVAANLEVTADGQTLESLFVQDTDPNTGETRGLYKCSGTDCNGVTIGPAVDDADSFAPYILRYRMITIKDALLQSVNADGTTGAAGPATVRASINSFEIIFPDGTYAADLPCSQGEQMLSVAFTQGNQSLTVCPPTSLDPDGGFQLDYFLSTTGDVSSLKFIAYNFNGNGRTNGVEVTMSGDTVASVVFIGYPSTATFSCTGAACTGVTVSPPDGSGARSVSFASTVLQEVETAGLLDPAFTATINGTFVAPPP